MKLIKVRMALVGSITSVVQKSISKTQDFLKKEFALSYGIWELLRYEKILEIYVLATLLTRNSWLFMEKHLSNIKCQHVISEFLGFWRSGLHRINGKFTLNLCGPQVFKTRSSEISS